MRVVRFSDEKLPGRFNGRVDGLNENLRSGEIDPHENVTVGNLGER